MPLARWSITGADPETGKTLTVEVMAGTEKEALEKAKFQGVYASRVLKIQDASSGTEAGPLDYARPLPPITKPEGPIPTYRSLQFFSIAASAVGSLCALGAALMIFDAFRTGDMEPMPMLTLCLVAAGLLACAGESMRALRDVAINSHRWRGS